MKKIVLIALALVLTFPSWAQLSWEARLGGAVSQFTESSSKMRLGLKASGIAEYAVTDLFAVRSGLSFVMKGGSKDSSFAIKGSDALGVDYLSLPVMASFRFPVTDAFSLAVNAGPYFACKVGSSSGVEAEDFDMGVGVGLDLVLGRIVLAPDIEYGFTNVFKKGADKNLTYGLSLGYKF